MLNSGFSFLKNQIFEKTYEEFYKEAKDKFEFKYGMKIKDEISTLDLHLLKKIDLGMFGSGVIVQQKKTKSQFCIKRRKPTASAKN